ncbi:MAG: hypothetical protein KatS3mg108_3195 [Isosphaeraceae bacterium]|jgi:hypothetical protein|nr:MAG: hypothetical protein KatS3mg108_3195 [Isosphaeraceae bacterium]
MHRMLQAAVCLTLLVLPATGWQTSRHVTTPELIDAAHQWLARGDARKAVRLLELALAQADSTADRTACRDALRRAYPLAAEQASQAGLTTEAEQFRVNLQILELRNPAPSTGPPAPPPAADEPSNPPQPSELPPATATPWLAEPPALLPRPEVDLGQQTPAQSGSTALAPPATPSRRPSSAATAATNPPPSPATDNHVQRVSESNPQPAEGSSLPPSVESSEPARPDSPAPPPPDPEPDNAARLAEADDAFRAQRYADAGAIYAQLYADGRLPKARYDAFAYCRRYDVVRRINDKPRHRDEWKTIRDEIQAIRRLTPDHWYDEYLLNLVDELSSRAQAAPRADRQTRPASHPSPPISRYARPAADIPSTAPPQLAASPQATPRPPLVDGDSDKWQVLKTANFLIYHADPDLARKVAEAAEAARLAAWNRWADHRPLAPWNPPCYLYLFPDAGIFAAVTGQPADSPGFSTVGFLGGHVTARRINLRAGHPKLVDAVLPHEVTHVVLAEILGEVPIPRWADEGIAALSEPDAEQALRAGELADQIDSPQLFPIRDLLLMDYPDEHRWPLYYAQSISLTRFLVQLKGERIFLQFLRDAARHGYDVELARVYGFASIDDLEYAWKSRVATALAGHDRSSGSSVR